MNLMHLSEEELKDMLRGGRAGGMPDAPLENEIMQEIDGPDPYDSLLKKSKDWARISLRVSLSLAGCLVVSLAYWLYLNSSPPEKVVGQILPSVLVVGLLLVSYQLFYFRVEWGGG